MSGILYLGDVLSRDAMVLDNLAINLANVNTPGYKRKLWSAELGRLLQLEAGTSAKPALGVDAQPGQFHADGDLRHAAIVGPGFFELATPSGMVYTRRGDFSLSPEGYLVLAPGLRVQGKSGDIVLTQSDFSIRNDGVVMQGDTEVGQIKVVDMAPGSLQATERGDLFYGAPVADPGPSPVLAPGNLELSNVDVPAALVELYALQRHFETTAQFMGLYGDMNRSLLGLLDTM